MQGHDGRVTPEIGHWNTERRLEEVTLPISMRCSDLAGEPVREGDEVEDERKRPAPAWTVMAV